MARIEPFEKYINEYDKWFIIKQLDVKNYIKFLCACDQRRRKGRNAHWSVRKYLG